MNHLIAAFLLAFPAEAEPLTVEATVKGNVAALKATTEGKNVLFIPLSPGLSPAIPDTFLMPKTAIYTGAPGSYHILAITSIKDELTQKEIVFTLEGPPAPPVPPLPPDPLPAKVKDAYTRDTSPAAAKSERAAKLVGLYTAAIKVADDQSLLTVADFTKDVTAVRDSMFPADDVLREVRVLLAQEMAAAIGPSTSTSPLNRDAAKVVCTRIANALKKVAQ